MDQHKGEIDLAGFEDFAWEALEDDYEELAEESRRQGNELDAACIEGTKEFLESVFDVEGAKSGVHDLKYQEWSVEEEGKKTQGVVLPEDGAKQGQEDNLAWLLDADKVEILQVLKEEKKVVVKSHDVAKDGRPEDVKRESRKIEAEESLSEKPEHIVVLMLENRSFDQMLGKVEGMKWDQRTGLTKAELVVWPDPDHDILGVQSIQLNNGEDNTREKTNDRSIYCDCDRFLQTTGFEVSYNLLKETKELDSKYLEKRRKAAYDGRMDLASACSSVCSYKPSDIPAMVELAETFCVSDRYHASLAGPTVPNRMLLLTCACGDEDGHNPEGGLEALEYWRGMRENRTIFQRLETCEYLSERPDTKAWRVYYHDTPLSMFLSGMKGRDHGNFVRYNNKFAEDVSQGKLPLLSFIEPRYYDREKRGEYANDQHPPHHVGLGDELIRDVFETLAKNEEVFKKTLLIITYDENGGFYDHVAPPSWNADAAKRQTMRVGGLRVPALFVSPRVHKKSVIRSESLRYNDGTLKKFRQGSGRNAFFSHESLAATLSQWYEMEPLLNVGRRDEAAPNFCHVWNKEKSFEVDAILKTEKSYTREAGSKTKPAKHAIYPNTGAFKWAEKLVCDVYLDKVRPALNKIHVVVDKLQKVLHKVIPVLEKTGLVPKEIIEGAKNLANGGLKQMLVGSAMTVATASGNPHIAMAIDAIPILVKMLDRLMSVVTRVRRHVRRSRDEKDRQNQLAKAVAREKAALAKHDQRQKDSEAERQSLNREAASVRQGVQVPANDERQRQEAVVLEEARKADEIEVEENLRKDVKELKEKKQ